MRVNEVVLHLGYKPSIITCSYIMDAFEKISDASYLGWVPKEKSIIVYLVGDNKDIEDIASTLIEERIIDSFENRRVNRSESTLKRISTASEIAREIAYNIYALSDLLTFREDYIDMIFKDVDIPIRDEKTLERLRRIAASEGLLWDELLKQEIMLRTLALFYD